MLVCGLRSVDVVQWLPGGAPRVGLLEADTLVRVTQLLVLALAITSGLSYSELPGHALGLVGGILCATLWMAGREAGYETCAA